MKSHIVVENLSSHKQSGWIFVGLPDSDVPSSEGGYLSDGVFQYPYVTHFHGIYVLVSLESGHRKKLEFAGERAVEPFAWSPFISDYLERVVPKFMLGNEEGQFKGISYVDGSDAHNVWRIDVAWPERLVNIVMWATATSGSPDIAFTVQAVYGSTTNNGQAQAVTMPELTMRSGFRFVSDFAVRNGQTQASWDVEAKCWTMTLVGNGKLWHRASRFETRGAIMCSPDQSRADGLPMQGLYAGWDGKWMALGKVPQPTPDLSRLRVSQRNEYINPTWGGYSQRRLRTQPHESGTTGEQADFGCASDLAVTTMDPWEIHDALWQCQSYVQRPTANREPSGSQMNAGFHPQAETLNQRPDLSLGIGDRLGWPGANQIGWIPSPSTCAWTTSDDQHRADNFLHATYALTRDPALGSLIYDHIQLDLTDVNVKYKRALSPRSVGRLALTRANQVWLGFEDVIPTLQNGILSSVVPSPLLNLAPEKKVRTIGGREQAKYGWISSSGQPVIGWQGWQEAIAAIGILAAGRVLRNDSFIDMAAAIAKSVTKNCWKLKDGKYLHAYAIRWNEGDELPESAWPTTLNSSGEASNDHIYISGACNYWTMAAAAMLAPFDEDAKKVLNSFKPFDNVFKARWGAI
jgi:hypothetical protein